jgi:prophage regulatory protein
MTTDHLEPAGRLLAWPAVRERVGISRTTAWRLQKDGAFPKPVVISAGRVGWREEDIIAWAASLSARDGRQLQGRLPTPSSTPVVRQRSAKVPTEG